MKVPCNEFDGKVIYGEKRTNAGSGYESHVAQMAPVVKELAQLESKAQMNYLKQILMPIAVGRKWYILIFVLFI